MHLPDCKRMDFIVCWGVRKDIYDEFSNSSTVPVQNKPFLSPAEYRQFSLEKRAKLLPPPSDDRMEELKIGRETQTERELNSTQRGLKWAKGYKKANRARVEFYPEGTWNEQKGRKKQAEQESSST